MIVAVIPAKNEGENIAAVLNQLRYLPIDRIIPVLNGCSDCTLEVVESHCLRKKMQVVEYAEPLGLDVPRAVGARLAFKMGASAVLFIDGDMVGSLRDCLCRLIREVMSNDGDLALTNCYPYLGYRSAVAQEVLQYREQLNRTLGIFTELGLATPSHGPHCVSRKLLQAADWRSFAVPPMLLAQAVQKKLGIKVAASLSSEQWHSAQRGDRHNSKIAETIIGDCLEAGQYFQGLSVNRIDRDKCFLGYHKERKIEVLDQE